MALTGKALQDKLFNDATRLFIFSASCPAKESPYRFNTVLMIEALRTAKDEILEKNPKNKFLNTFIPSVINHFDNVGYLSNKQIGVVEDILSKNEFDVEAIKEAAAREVEIAFVEFQQKYASIIEGSFLKKATENYEAYCNHCREMAARRKSRRAVGSHQYRM